MKTTKDYICINIAIAINNNIPQKKKKKKKKSNYKDEVLSRSKRISSYRAYQNTQHFINSPKLTHEECEISRVDCITIML